MLVQREIRSGRNQRSCALESRPTTLGSPRWRARDSKTAHTGVHAQRSMVEFSSGHGISQLEGRRRCSGALDPLPHVAPSSDPLPHRQPVGPRPQIVSSSDRKARGAALWNHQPNARQGEGTPAAGRAQGSGGERAPPA
jgi:hypothetical protein